MAPIQSNTFTVNANMFLRLFLNLVPFLTCQAQFIKEVLPKTLVYHTSRRSVPVSSGCLQALQKSSLEKHSQKKHHGEKEEL